MLKYIENKEAEEKIAEMNAEQILDKIVEIKDPVINMTVGEMISNLKATARNEKMNVVVSLANGDIDQMLACLYQDNAQGILYGAEALAKILGAEKIVLILPESLKEQEVEKNFSSSECPTEILYGMCSRMSYTTDLLVHPIICAKCFEALKGEEVHKTILSVNGQQPQEVAYGTVLEQIIPEAKAVRIGNRIWGEEVRTQILDETFPIENGVIETYSETECVVKKVEEFIGKLRATCCGKCVFCREGLVQIHEGLKDLTAGKAKLTDIELMKELAEIMQQQSNCSLGQTAPGMILGLQEHFADDIKEHLAGRCHTLTCKALVHYYIDPKMCKGDGHCVENCPKKAIDGGKDFVGVIDEFECDKCGKCMDICANGAIKRVTGRLPKLPDEPIALKKSKDASETQERKTRKRVKPKALLYKKKVSGFTEDSNSQTVKVKGNLPMREMNADVIIVAAGPAGLAAAVTVGEHNLSSIVFEKSNTTGGAANMGMGPLGIDTKVQRRGFNQITVEKALDLHMDYTHWRVDADLVSTYFHKSADTIEWLESMGVEFAGAFKYFAESEATWHIVRPENGVIGPRAAGGMIKALTNRAKELGAQFEMETSVVELIKEGDKVCGVIAVDKDGQQIKAMAKSVIVATGGFGNNKEMLAKEFNLHLCEDFYPFMVPGIVGDGLNMMWKAGAMKYGAGIEAIYQLPDNLNWFLLDAVLRQPNLLINQLGERFMNEDRMGNTTFTGNAIALQPGNYAYCIVDGNILKYYKKNGPDIEDIVHPQEAFFGFEQQAALAVEQGYEAYFEAETLDELAEKLQMDPEVLKNTVDEYNEMCDLHCDTQFNKNPKFLHKITGKGKYLVGKFYLGAYGTIGGIRINKYCEVLDDNFMPIEGLYSAGSDANTIYGDSYNFTLPGNTMGFAVNSGRMAGESVAEYIQEQI